MKSRYLVLVPIILLALFLIPMILLRNELFTKRDLKPVPRESAEQIQKPQTTPEPEPKPEKPEPPKDPVYTFAPPSPDGIGKIFMGREISHVMGHPGIGWLERGEREKEEAPNKAIALLGLAPDTVIADIGAGSGYYTFRIAPLVPKGKVIAVDIQQEMLDFLTKEAAKRRVGNVQPYLGNIKSTGLPENSIDAALMVDAYHEFSHPAEMLDSLHKALKPGGKIYLLEYRAEDPEVPIKRLHKMSAVQARKEFEAHGFTFLENKPDLPWQHLLIFEKSKDSTSTSQAADHILKKLETIRIPRVDFEDTTVEEAIDFLRLRMAELDGDPTEKRGVSVIIRKPRRENPSDESNKSLLLDSTAGAAPLISLTLRDAPVTEVLKAIAEKADLDIYITTRSLLITPAGTISSPASDPEILSTIYRHPDP